MVVDHLQLLTYYLLLSCHSLICNNTTITATPTTPTAKRRTYINGLKQGQRVPPPDSIPQWHWQMIHDWSRNEKYEIAIKETIQQQYQTKNVTVFDIGAGIGLLSLISARSGAFRVVAVEHSPLLGSLAKSVIEENGYKEKIQLYIGDALDLLDIPSNVKPHEPRVLVHELFGPHMLCEFCHQIIPIARERLHPHVIIPSSARTYAVLVDSKYLSGQGANENDHNANSNDVMGFKVNSIAHHFDQANHLIGTVAFALDDLIQISKPIAINEMNFVHGIENQIQQLAPQTGSYFNVTKKGVARAVLIYWSATLSKDNILSTSPFVEENGSKPSFSRMTGWPHVMSAVLKSSEHSCSSGDDSKGTCSTKEWIEWDGVVNPDDRVGYKWSHKWPTDWWKNNKEHTMNSKSSHGCGVHVALTSINGQHISQKNRHQSVDYNPQVVFPIVEEWEEVDTL